jgi:hypothetical protein
LTFVKPEPERPDDAYELEKDKDNAAEDADTDTETIVVHEGQRGFRDSATD